MQRTTKEVQEVGERWVHFCSGLKELKVYFQAQPAGGAEDSTEMANFPAPPGLGPQGVLEVLEDAQ